LSDVNETVESHQPLPAHQLLLSGFELRRKVRTLLESPRLNAADNFCCSHRCTSDVHFGQGRAGASNTSASRYFTNSCYDAPPCGEASSGTARLYTASTSQNRLRSNIESANRRFPPQLAREQRAFGSTDAEWRDEFQVASRLQKSSIVPFRICDMVSRIVKSNFAPKF
jgi:hypothetical protein